MQSNNIPNKKKVALKIINSLEKEYPDAKTSLQFVKPLEILIATILSAQCTDKQVNIVTKTLFKKFKNAKDYAKADVSELEKYIKSTGFYRNKAKNIKNSGRLLVTKYDSKVPNTMAELIELPGVARKTANIVLSNAFGINVGIAVDTHVKRLSKRLGLVTNTNPNKIELELMEIIPEIYWKRITDLFIAHGRKVCTARKMKCNKCILNRSCPSTIIV